MTLVECECKNRLFFIKNNYNEEADELTQQFICSKCDRVVHEETW
jgi:hypothetical protein